MKFRKLIVGSSAIPDIAIYGTQLIVYLILMED